MDLLQLVFGFVNAPLFATFLLGMFWKRTTGHGAFSGLLSGTTRRRRDARLDSRRRQGRMARRRSTSFRRRWRRISGSRSSRGPRASSSRSWSASPRGRNRNPNSADLVYGFTELPSEQGVVWYKRPGPLAIVVSRHGDRVKFLVLVNRMDLRVPSGWFFLLLGAILIAMGTLTTYSAPLTSHNVNCMPVWQWLFSEDGCFGCRNRSRKGSVSEDLHGGAAPTVFTVRQAE